MKRLLLAIALLCVSIGSHAQTTCKPNVQGGDVSTDGQVCSTHLNSPLPVSQGGTGSSTGAGAQISSPSFFGNFSGQTASPGAVNPLAVVSMLSLMLSVDVASFAGNITLSGQPTIDGGTVIAGQSVLVAAQTSASQNGIYIVTATGNWNRANNFNNYTISQFCDVQVFVSHGTTYEGHTFSLSTSASSITIGTTAQSWSDVSLKKATATVAGITWTTAQSFAANPAALWFTLPTNANDCVSVNDVLGNLLDLNGTPCAFADPNFNYAAAEGNATAPVVTGSGCSLVSGGLNNSGAITATGADTCTLTFGGTGGFPKAAPFCSVVGESSTVLPYVGTRPTQTAVIYKTAAAGTFEYVCM